MLKRSQPIFAVRDVREALAFYRDVLGFGSEWLWDDPPTFGGVTFGDVCVMFSRNPDLAAKVEGHEHAFWADEIDALHERHRSGGAPIISPIENKPWHIREYTVRNLNGYHLRFGGPLVYQRPAAGAGSLPGYMQIEERKPTPEELTSIHQAVGWSTTNETLEVVRNAFTTFVAVDFRHGCRAVGVTRVMRDSPGWYSLWDVAVLPDYQSQKIGTALVEAAINGLRERSPGATVFLFTMKPEFYAKLGFKQDGVSMLRL